jgi:hypothetical protein
VKESVAALWPCVQRNCWTCKSVGTLGRKKVFIWKRMEETKREREKPYNKLFAALSTISKTNESYWFLLVKLLNSILGKFGTPGDWAGIWIGNAMYKHELLNTPSLFLCPRLTHSTLFFSCPGSLFPTPSVYSATGEAPGSDLDLNHSPQAPRGCGCCHLGHCTVALHPSIHALSTMIKLASWYIHHVASCRYAVNFLMSCPPHRVCGNISTSQPPLWLLHFHLFSFSLAVCSCLRARCLARSPALAEAKDVLWMDYIVESIIECSSIIKCVCICVLLGKIKPGCSSMCFAAADSVQRLGSILHLGNWPLILWSPFID